MSGAADMPIGCALIFCICHSGAPQRGEPGIHNHRSCRTVAEIILQQSWLWIPDLPRSLSSGRATSREPVGGNPE